MRWIIFIGLIAFFSCKKDLASTTPVVDNIDTTTADIKYDGSFMNGPFGSVSGMVKIYTEDQQYSLALINVVISNGPDLHVYLSKEEQPGQFIDLGKLKSTTGNQVYSITGMPDFSEYKYVLIHCQKYNHLFGAARIAQ